MPHNNLCKASAIFTGSYTLGKGMYENEVRQLKYLQSKHDQYFRKLFCDIS